ncbi:MAG: hypothetical protein IT169_19845 [Bryobacterales bacterium]|nr:hypothetical protein [Bryobacterales bacterium]
MHGAMDTFRAMIRFGSFVFVLLSFATCSSLFKGPVAGIIQAVFSSRMLLSIFEQAGR